MDKSLGSPLKQEGRLLDKPHDFLIAIARSFLGPLGIERIHIRGPNESFGKEDGAKQLFAFAFAGVPALEPILHPIIQGGAIFGGGAAGEELFELFVGIIRDALSHACRDLGVELQ